MSDEKKKDGPEAPALKELSKKHFNDQIKEAENTIGNMQQQVNALQDQIQQQVGIIRYAQHILKTFKLADAPPEPEKKKTDLEVK